MLAIPWSAYDGEPIRLRQSKRKHLIEMPASRLLKALLDARPRTAKTILTRADSQPCSMSNFNTHWRTALLKAGCDGLHFHDLCSTARTVLAQAEATPSEIVAMLGWTVSTIARMLDLYQAMPPRSATVPSQS